MKYVLTILSLIVCAASISFSWAEETEATESEASKAETVEVTLSNGDKFKIVESHIADNCYTKVEEDREIDTVVVHFASAIYWFNESFQEIVGAEGKEYAESINLTPENLADHKYDWQLVKAIFEAYKVSAHYAIARDGTIVQLVPDNDRAWHAGRSVMPNDKREGINDFSIGIELMASHPKDDPTVKTEEDAYTDAQYKSLNKLIQHFCEEHGVQYIVGHDEIAPERKNDPGPLFQWDRVRNDDYSPRACEDESEEEEE